jgi:ABC-type spermidine/putrescine transport system permease subunit II
VSGATARQRIRGRIRSPSIGQVAASAYLVFVLIWLFAPIAVVVLFSLTTTPRMTLPFQGWTLDWYGVALSEPLLQRAIVNSVILAAVTAVVATALGVGFSFGVVKLRRRTRSLFVTGSLLPAAIPVLVVGMALAVFFRTLGQPPSLVNAAVGHILIALPFVILTMNARLETFDFSTLDAARDLGAGPLRTFRDITFPLIRPSVIGAALIAIALSLDEFVVTWFNIGNLMTVPVYIWGLVRKGIDPSVNALATMTFATLVVLVVISNLIGRRRS